MSWLSHFTNWVGEKSKVILPVATGLAGFAAGMIPGVGGTVSKFIDKLGNKISGASDTLGLLGGGDQDNSPAAPTSPAVQKVTGGEIPDQLPSLKPVAAPTAEKTNPLVWAGLGLAALLAFGGGGGRRR